MTDAAAIRPLRAPLRRLAPVTAIVFLGFLAISVVLPVIPLLVRQDWGFSATTAGWAVGVQSLATVTSRQYAGTLSDRRGPRSAVLLGLPLCAAAGLASLWAAVAADHSSALVILLAGRILLGIGESLFLTGAMSWGIARMTAPQSGRVIAWQGLAMFGAVTLGAPLGLALHRASGFAAVALLATAAPLVAIVIAVALPAAPPPGGTRLPFLHVVRAIARFGVVLTLAAVPYATLLAFLGLRYAALGWSGEAGALAAFGGGYVMVRLFFAGLPARYGGRRVALVSLMVGAVGQGVIVIAPGPTIVAVGALLAGFGFSMVYPALGVELLQRLPPANRGAVIGGFSAFFDIALGASGPILGLLADHAGYGSVFVAAAICLAGAIALLATAPRAVATQEGLR